MNVYLVNNNNKNELLSIRTESDDYELKSNETNCEYPETEIGYTRCFNFDEWEWSDPIEDNRNVRIYSKYSSLSSKIFHDIGDLPKSYTKVTPPDTEKNYKFNDDTGEWEEIIPIVDPVKYSKYLICKKLKSLNLWNEIKELLIERDVYDEFGLCTYLQDDDELFLSMKEYLKTTYPQYDIDEILSECLY